MILVGFLMILVSFQRFWCFFEGFGDFLKVLVGF